MALLDAPGFPEVGLDRRKIANAGGMTGQRVVAEPWKTAPACPSSKATGWPLDKGGASGCPRRYSQYNGTILLPHLTLCLISNVVVPV